MSDLIESKVDLEDLADELAAELGLSPSEDHSLPLLLNGEQISEISVYSQSVHVDNYYVAQKILVHLAGGDPRKFRWGSGSVYGDLGAKVGGLIAPTFPDTEDMPLNDRTAAARRLREIYQQSQLALKKWEDKDVANAFKGLIDVMRETEKTMYDFVMSYGVPTPPTLISDEPTPEHVSEVYDVLDRMFDEELVRDRVKRIDDVGIRPANTPDIWVNITDNRYMPSRILELGILDPGRAHLSIELPRAEQYNNFIRNSAQEGVQNALRERIPWEGVTVSERFYEPIFVGIPLPRNDEADPTLQDWLDPATYLSAFMIAIGNDLRKMFDDTVTKASAKVQPFEKFYQEPKKLE